MSEALDAAIERAREWHRTATPEEKAAMWEKQRESWVRAFSTPCQHGELDFEQCGECIAAARKRLAPPHKETLI